MKRLEVKRTELLSMARRVTKLARILDNQNLVTRDDIDTWIVDTAMARDAANDARESLEAMKTDIDNLLEEIDTFNAITYGDNPLAATVFPLDLERALKETNDT